MSRAVWIGRDLPPIWRDGEEYFVLSVDEQLYLVRNACPHRGGPLKFGQVDDQDRVVCPMHHNAVPVETLLAWPTTIRLTEAVVPFPLEGGRVRDGGGAGPAAAVTDDCSLVPNASDAEGPPPPSPALPPSRGKGEEIGAGLLRRLVHEDGRFKLANLVTLSRAALIVPILLLLLDGKQTPAFGLYVLAALTDVFDGWIARATGQSSRFGAQLDAAVDNIFSLAILAFLLLAWPGLWERQWLSLIILFGGPLLYLVVSWLMRRRLMMFHFWSAKVGAFLLFCLWPLIVFSGAESLIGIVALVVGFSRLEQVVYMLRGGEDLNAPHGFGPIAPAASA